MRNPSLAPTIAILSMLVLPAAGAGQTLLLSDAYHPCWARDGSAILCDYLPVGAEHAVIVRVPITGGEMDTLIEDPEGPWFPMILPDGRHIAYYRTREIVVHDLDGGAPVVWEVPDAWDDYGFVLTPDGLEVIYTTTTHEIMALDLAAGTTRLIRSGHRGTISPDGQWFAFGTTEDSITVVPVAGGSETVLGFGAWPGWTPDSEQVVFTAASLVGEELQLDLLAVSRDGTERERLTADPEWDEFPVVSPLGNQIAFMKGVGEFGTRDLWVMDFEFSSTSTKKATWGGVKALYR